MKKKIEIIVAKTIPKLGKSGSIIKVNPGYAFNYLIPNNFATIATKGIIKHVRMFEKIQQEKAQEASINAQIIKEHLETISKISIKKKVGENQQIFGSVTSREILTEILKYTGKQLEKKQITLPEIKTIGIYTINIQMTDQLTTVLKLQVLPENI